MANISPNLAYVISCPIDWHSAVLGVMNIDFSIKKGAPSTDKKVIEDLVAAEPLRTKLVARMEEKARLIAAVLAKSRLQRVWLIHGV